MKKNLLQFRQVKNNIFSCTAHFKLFWRAHLVYLTLLRDLISTKKSHISLDSNSLPEDLIKRCVTVCTVKAAIHYRQVPATCRRRQVACLRRQVAEVQHVQLSATCRQKQQLVSAVYQHLSPVSACRRFINIHDVSRGWSNKTKNLK